MSAQVREVTFQLFGAGLALFIALGGVFLAQAVLGPVGRNALFVSVPAGVILGYATVKLLEFAYRLLVEES